MPNPVLDDRELDKIDLLTVDYEKYREPGSVSKIVSSIGNSIGNSIGKVVPEEVKDQFDKMIQGFSEADFIKQALGVIAEGFKVIESMSANLTIDKKSVIKRLNKENASIKKYSDVCFARGYEIESALNLKDMEDILYAATQGGITGFFGFAGIPFNLVLCTFLYFRAVQNIALHYGYDVKKDAGELQIASVITMQALSPNMETGAGTLSSYIGKMMIMTKTTALQQGLSKSYTAMASKGGIQLIYVQIRALANAAAEKALEKAGKKGLEKTVFSEMLEQLGKHLPARVGKRGIPIIGAVIGLLFDSAYMARVLKYAKIVYHKRFLLEKEQRIMHIVEKGN